MGSNTHELAPSAPPDREGWWYGRYRDDPANSQCIWFVSAYMGKFAVLGESDDPRYGVAYVPDKFDWFGPVPTEQEWHEAKAELAMLWAMKEPSTLAEIDAAIARLQLAREEFL